MITRRKASDDVTNWRSKMNNELRASKKHVAKHMHELNGPAIYLHGCLLSVFHHHIDIHSMCSADWAYHNLSQVIETFKDDNLNFRCMESFIITESRNGSPYFGSIPPPRTPVANEHVQFTRIPDPKNEIILVVTGILGGHIDPNHTGSSFGHPRLSSCTFLLEVFQLLA